MDARSVRPLYQRLQHRGFNGDGRTDRASLQPLLVKIVTRRGFNGDGRHPARHFRASLQRLLVPTLLPAPPSPEDPHERSDTDHKK